jgi:putative membrane protein
MIAFLKRWLITALAVAVAAKIVSGISYDHLEDLLWAALLLGVLNAVVRPIMMVLSLPLVIGTLGLFILVINALMFYLVGHVLKGFHVSSFWDAFWGSLIVSVVSLVLNALTKSDNSRAQFRFHRKPPQAPPPPPSSDDTKGPIIDV